MALKGLTLLLHSSSLLVHKLSEENIKYMLRSICVPGNSFTYKQSNTFLKSNFMINSILTNLRPYLKEFKPNTSGFHIFEDNGATQDSQKHSVIFVANTKLAKETGVTFNIPGKLMNISYNGTIDEKHQIKFKADSVIKPITIIVGDFVINLNICHHLMSNNVVKSTQTNGFSSSQIHKNSLMQSFQDCSVQTEDVYSSHTLTLKQQISGMSIKTTPSTDYRVDDNHGLEIEPVSLDTSSNLNTSDQKYSSVQTESINVYSSDISNERGSDDVQGIDTETNSTRNDATPYKESVSTIFINRTIPCSNQSSASSFETFNSHTNYNIPNSDRSFVSQSQFCDSKNSQTCASDCLFENVMQNETKIVSYNHDDCVIKKLSNTEICDNCSERTNNASFKKDLEEGSSDNFEELLNCLNIEREKEVLSSTYNSNITVNQIKNQLSEISVSLSQIHSVIELMGSFSEESTMPIEEIAGKKDSKSTCSKLCSINKQNKAYPKDVKETETSSPKRYLDGFRNSIVSSKVVDGTTRFVERNIIRCSMFITKAEENLIAQSIIKNILTSNKSSDNVLYVRHESNVNYSCNTNSCSEIGNVESRHSTISQYSAFKTDMEPENVNGEVRGELLLTLERKKKPIPHTLTASKPLSDLTTSIFQPTICNVDDLTRETKYKWVERKSSEFFKTMGKRLYFNCKLQARSLTNFKFKSKTSNFDTTDDGEIQKIHANETDKTVPISENGIIKKDELSGTTSIVELYIKKSTAVSRNSSTNTEDIMPLSQNSLQAQDDMREYSTVDHDNEKNENIEGNDQISNTGIYSTSKHSITTLYKKSNTSMNLSENILNPAEEILNNNIEEKETKVLSLTKKESIFKVKSYKLSRPSKNYGQKIKERFSNWKQDLCNSNMTRGSKNKKNCMKKIPESSSINKGSQNILYNNVKSDKNVVPLLGTKTYTVLENRELLGVSGTNKYLEKSNTDTLHVKGLPLPNISENVKCSTPKKILNKSSKRQEQRRKKCTIKLKDTVSLHQCLEVDEANINLQSKQSKKKTLCSVYKHLFTKSEKKDLNDTAL